MGANQPASVDSAGTLVVGNIKRVENVRNGEKSFTDIAVSNVTESL